MLRWMLLCGLFAAGCSTASSDCERARARLKRIGASVPAQCDRQLPSVRCALDSPTDDATTECMARELDGMRKVIPKTLAAPAR